MSRICLISAICTPLTPDEQLHREGLEAHLSDQRNAGIKSVFVAGSMGSMQLLTDETYRRLVKRSVELCGGDFELLAGAGDTSFARTRDRIEFLNGCTLDGVVVLAPYFFRFSQVELIEYFTSLAEVSKAPLYLYDLPQVTGTKIEFETAVQLSGHPNIAGIKCSDEPGYAWRLHDRLGDSFRVIMAQSDLLEVFLRSGLNEQLDGMFAVAPHWTTAIAACVAEGDWEGAHAWQRKLSKLKQVALKAGDSAFTAMLNARGIPGRAFPLPTRELSDQERAALFADPIVKEYVSSGRVAVAH